MPMSTSFATPTRERGFGSGVIRWLDVPLTVAGAPGGATPGLAAGGIFKREPRRYNCSMPEPIPTETSAPGRPVVAGSLPWYRRALVVVPVLLLLAALALPV